jgi:hypothetical protein
MHDPTEQCEDRHCYSHHEDEDAAGAYIVCGECGHVYPTARALRRRYRRMYWETTGRSSWPDGFRSSPGIIRRLWRLASVRARSIHFCQHCIHDF